MRRRDWSGGGRRRGEWQGRGVEGSGEGVAAWRGVAIRPMVAAVAAMTVVAAVAAVYLVFRRRALFWVCVEEVREGHVRALRGV